MITTVNGMEKEETHTVSLIECHPPGWHSIKINYDLNNGLRRAIL